MTIDNRSSKQSRREVVKVAQTSQRQEQEQEQERKQEQEQEHRNAGTEQSPSTRDVKEPEVGAGRQETGPDEARETPRDRIGETGNRLWRRRERVEERRMYVV